jgi:hypothetical protein
MRTLTAAELLALCEAGEGRSSVERALMVLRATYPEAPSETLASLSIGARDSRLLAVREQVFGRTLASLSHCPECGETVEQIFSVETVRVPSSADDPLALSADVDGQVVPFRLPNSDDLAALADLDDADIARTCLVQRCVLAEPFEAANRPGLSERAIQAIADRMARADPQGDVQLVTICPRCSSEWTETFDIVSFLWSELTAWSIRFLDDVHRLASAYGWSEADILTMTPSRRAMYLARIGA